MRPISDKSLREIQEFKFLGFARSSHVLLRHMRKYNDSHLRIFKSGVTARAGSIKYSSIDIFGGSIVYIYDVRRKKEFVDFLVNRFIAKNPDPDAGIRKAFTRVLHYNGLHWDGCWHLDKDKKIKI